MRAIFRTLIVVTVVLLVPIVPFLAFGPQLENWIERFLDDASTARWTAVGVVGLLSTDVFLPIPSSVVTTVAGARLGVWGGTFAAWFGMSLGAVAGFGLARRFGQGLASRFLADEQMARDCRLSDRHGPWLLVVTRAVPVMAEAMVLLAGVHRLGWRRFLPPVLLSNLGIAVAYTALGNVAAQQHWLPMALGISAALPFLLLAVVRSRRRQPTRHEC